MSDEELIIRKNLTSVSYLVTKMKSFNERSKLAQKESKTRQDWELGKRLKFDYAWQMYKHKPESTQGNWTYEILWHFEI